LAHTVLTVVLLDRARCNWWCRWRLWRFLCGKFDVFTQRMWPWNVICLQLQLRALFCVSWYGYERLHNTAWCNLLMLVEPQIRKLAELPCTQAVKLL